METERLGGGIHGHAIIIARDKHGNMTSIRHSHNVLTRSMRDGIARAMGLYVPGTTLFPESISLWGGCNVVLGLGQTASDFAANEAISILAYEIGQQSVTGTTAGGSAAAGAYTRVSASWSHTVSDSNWNLSGTFASGNPNSSVTVAEVGLFAAASRASGTNVSYQGGGDTTGALATIWMPVWCRQTFAAIGRVSTDSIQVSWTFSQSLS